MVKDQLMDRQTSVLTEEELIYILEVQIPDLLDRRPELQRRIYSAFLDLFARREEIAAIMEELRSLHTEFQEFREETAQRFDQVEQRFERIDQRFEGVDQRFDQVEQRFERIDQRFEGVDQRFDQVEQRFERIDQRFEGVDQRFDQVEQRFERVDQRFEGIDQRLDEIAQEVRESREETARRFDQVEQRFAQMSKHFEDLRDWVELVVGRAQVRSGRNLEDVVAAALRVALKRPDIRPESIRLRQKIVDTEGWVFPRGRQKEVDLVATDDEYLVFEVKSAAEVDDVDYFADKVELVQRLNPDKKVRGVFITLAPEPDVQQRCQELGIELAR
jgi:hypothetical protein